MVVTEDFRFNPVRSAKFVVPIADYDGYQLIYSRDIAVFTLYIGTAKPQWLASQNGGSLYHMVVRLNRG